MLRASEEHFSLRKLNIGVCSVILGLTFVGITTQKVYADTSIGTLESKQSNSTEMQVSAQDVSVENGQIKSNQNDDVDQNKPTIVQRVSSETNPSIITRKENGIQSINNKSLNVKSDNENNTLPTKKLTNNKPKESLHKVALYTVPDTKGSWHYDGNNWTYSKADGKQANEEWVLAPDNKWYYFDDDGDMAHDGWVNTYNNDGTNWTYSKADGKQANEEWVLAPDNKWYYFDDDGDMAHDGWVDTNYNGSWSKYYFDPSGHFTVNAWHKDNNGNWSYSKADGKQANEEWVNVPGDAWYYFDDDGNMAHDGVKKDIPTINGGVVNTYYFDHDGHYEVNTWHKDGNEKIYFKSDGTQANQEWVTTATGRYYFDYKGQMVHGGWVFTIPTNGPVATYYFDDNGHYEVNTWHEDDGNLRYSKANGKQADNEWVITTDGQWHYFNSFGYMAHDCYLGIALPNSDSNVPATIPAYYFDHNGNYIKIGSLPDVENRYIVEEEPNPWCHKGNHLIYKKVDGTQVTNEWIVAGDGNRYYFDNNGYCTKREKINA